MHRIFWGAALVLLDWDVTLGTATFDVLPDFLGLMLLCRGLERNADRFGKIRHYAFAMELAAFLLYEARLLGTDPMSRMVIGLLNLLLRVAFLVLLSVVLRRTERQKSGDPVHGLFLVLAVLQPVCLLVQWIPIIGPISRVASIVFALCFLASFGSYLKKK